MKARKCDICRAFIETPEERAGAEMFYEVSISDAEAYEAESEAEKELEVILFDVCMPCAKKVKTAIKLLQCGVQA